MIKAICPDCRSDNVQINEWVDSTMNCLDCGAVIPFVNMGFVKV